MRNIVKILLLTLFAVLPLALNCRTKSLPSPQRDGGSNFMKAVSDRHSVRSYDPSKDVSDQSLGNILWAALGVNRDTKGNPKAPSHTNPTAMNRQEITAYVFDKEGVWLYEPDCHLLSQAAEGDHRNLIAGGQDFVMDAPFSVLFVADMSKLPEGGDLWGGVDAGIACENLTLACSALGLATVPRGSMDKDGISKLLNLGSKQIPMLNNPVGYEK